MLNEKMKAVQIAIEQIINSYPKDYLNIVFGDRIIKEDLILQIMLECCKYAYDSTAEKHSIRYYCKNVEKNEEDYFRMNLQRTIRKIYGYREKEYEYKKIHAEVDIPELLPPDMCSINNKMAGYKLNEFQYWEINDVHDNKFVDDIVSGRILNKNYKNDLFREYAKEYDDIIIEKLNCSYTVKDKFLALLACFTLEWKYAINLLYEIVTEMEKSGTKTIVNLERKYSLFCGPVALISNFDITGEIIHTDSRMLNIRRRFVYDFVHRNKINSLEYENQYREALVLQVLIYRKMRSWFVMNTGIDDWYSVAETYGVAECIIKEKDWTNKKIKYLKEIWNLVNFDYKNPENRSKN